METLEAQGAEFSEFEETADAFRQAGWEADYLQLERGAYTGQMLHTDWGGAQISRFTWRRRLRHRGLQPEGSIALGVTLCQQDHQQREDQGRFLGMPIGPSDVIVQRGARELEIFSASIWDTAVFTIPETAFAERGTPSTHGPGASPLPKHGLVTLSAENATGLRTACEAYFAAVAALRQRPDPEFPIESMAADLTSMAIRFVLDAQAEHLPRPSLLRRLQVIRQSEEFAQHSASPRPRIAELCQHIDTSERTLRSTFADLTGISPAAYLKAQRLSRVHSELLEANPRETLVKAVAYAHGFWHLGQFAHDYLDLFGEHPSETLLSSKRRPAPRDRLGPAAARIATS